MKHTVIVTNNEDMGFTKVINLLPDLVPKKDLISKWVNKWKVEVIFEKIFNFLETNSNLVFAL